MGEHRTPDGECAAAGTLTLSGAALREFLAAVLDKGAPRVGDVVGFRSGHETGWWMRRLVAAQGGACELRGDNCSPRGPGAGVESSTDTAGPECRQRGPPRRQADCPGGSAAADELNLRRGFAVTSHWE